ncbi:MAG: histidine phosphatase family protein [Dehalococcoidia bacterium]|nr:MAG: histidine phosphatase family protein [Dehalococcoidia bacterium]
MTEIILARHGETEWNVAEVFRGQIDIDLNETGVKQAELLSGYLSTSAIAAVYSSPLKRALKTAEIIAQPHKLKVDVEPDLIDFNFGKWQGLSHQEVKEKYRDLYATWITHPEQVRMPDGEALEDVSKRVIRVRNKVIENHRGTVVIVGHRVVNKVMICTLLGLDNSHFWKIRQDTCGISIFSYLNEQFILTKHNDTSFLRPVAGTPLRDF